MSDLVEKIDNGIMVKLLKGERELILVVNCDEMNISYEYRGKKIVFEGLLLPENNELGVFVKVENGTDWKVYSTVFDKIRKKSLIQYF